GVTVQSALPNWNSEYVAAEIIHIALEELGYEVQEVGDRSLDNPVIFTDMGQGNIDIMPNFWEPLHQAQVANIPAGGEDLALAGRWALGGALEGFLIDKATADEFGITSLADFEDPEIREQFDRDGDGLAEIVGCPPGWGCHDHINFLWDQYELHDYFNVLGIDTDIDYTPAMAETLALYEDGESIAFYTWTPNWTVYSLVPGEDVVWIEVPDPVEDSLTDGQVASGFSADDVTIPAVTGCVSDPCAMGFVGNDLGILAHQDFLDANPSAEALFDAVDIPLDFVFEQNNRMFEDGEDSFEDIRMHAEEWVEANRGEFDSWLDAARSAS
ncbi:MAG: glycine betaine/L-proline ABC transporter substrate-binding protein ProX, partial [Dehalococcoidia bacterium]